MKQISLLIAIAAFFASSVFAGEITLYSHRHYESDDALFDEFTKQTGIKVNVVKASADELIERLKAEGDNSPADILMAADAGRLERAKAANLLQPATSAVLEERIPENLRDPDNKWFGFTQRARIIAYDKDRVDPADLSTYEDLADPKWKSKVLARSSSNIYNQSLLASIIAAHGRDDAATWTKAVRENMARPPQGSDRDQMRAVAAGLGDLAIVNTYYVGLLANSEDPKDREVAEAIGVFFPNQDERGTHVNVSGAGLTKASKNPEDAIKFLEFLSSDGAQKTFPQTTYEYPVVDGIEWSDLQESWGEFKADTLNLSTLGELNESAVEVFNESGWE
ncbi:MAG: Fe(3+) ABC transporter substrate-binding protein [Verrucomicrobiota bacterium]